MQVTIRNNFFVWLAAMQDRSIKCTKYILLTIYVWYATPKRKPPDTCWNIVYKEFLTNLLYFVEDTINYTFKTDINVMFWSSFLMAQARSDTKCKGHKSNNLGHKYLYETKTTKVFKSNTKSIVQR